MRTTLDDELFDHRKIMFAGARLGKFGPALALGSYTAGLLYANKHLTDGFLPKDVVMLMPHLQPHPKKVADALVAAGLWREEDGGYRIHDFHKRNPKAADVIAKRASDRDRKEKAQKDKGNDKVH